MSYISLLKIRLIDKSFEGAGEMYIERSRPREFERLVRFLVDTANGTYQDQSSWDLMLLLSFTIVLNMIYNLICI